MEQIIKLVVDNGIAVACFIAFIYFIFIDKKESNELYKEQNGILKEISQTQIKMQVSLQQLNDRVEKLEKGK
jgi:Tfp pilus assembly protein PilO